MLMCPFRGFVSSLTWWGNLTCYIDEYCYVIIDEGSTRRVVGLQRLGHNRNTHSYNNNFFKSNNEATSEPSSRFPLSPAPCAGECNQKLALHRICCFGKSACLRLRAAHGEAMSLLCDGTATRDLAVMRAFSQPHACVLRQSITSPRLLFPS